MQVVLILTTLLILSVIGQIPLLIYFTMGILCVLIVRHYIKLYETNTDKTEDTHQ